MLLKAMGTGNHGPLCATVKLIF